MDEHDPVSNNTYSKSNLAKCSAGLLQFQDQEYQDYRTRFRSQLPEPQSDWMEPQYNHDHGSLQNPFSHEIVPQRNNDWDYPPNDMPEDHWQAPPPPMLPEPAYSSNWPSVPPPPPPSTWHGPPPMMPLPLPLHPPILIQPPPVLQAPYPPVRNDFFDYPSPYLPGLEPGPINHTQTPPRLRHLSSEPTFPRPLEKGHLIPPEVAPARGPAPRQQNKFIFNHHIKKGRSALVRRFFEADDDEESAGSVVPNSASGPPPVIHRAPEGPLQRVDCNPDVPLKTPEPPTKLVALPSPQSHSPPSRPATPKEMQEGIAIAPLSPIPQPPRESRPSVVEVTVPTPPITDSPGHDGLALVVIPIPVSQTSQRPPKATEPFEFLGLVGQGAYGKVFKARERATGALVALKKIKSEHAHDGFPVTGLREVKLLQSLKHDNVVALREMVSRKGDIYLNFEYVPHDLVGLLKQQHITLEHAHIKSLMHQLLKGLAYIHARGVLHRDLKAANLLVTANGTLKLADFGLARFYYKRNTKADYTNRVCTIWYRPPELMLGLTVYGPEVDIWSAG
jgi:Protein kinase domain